MRAYATWYEFKKDLERHAGRCLLNAEWLRVKPAAPLPWPRSHLRAALMRLRPTGNRTERVLDLVGSN